MTRFLLSMFVLLYSGALMAATAVVQTATGNITAAIGANAPVAITQNSTLESGMTVTTGDNSRIVMKFEDGQVIALNENTTFKISQYHYDQAKPEKSNMFFSLLKGAMRSVSGLIAKHNNEAFRLQTPVATIGIRGTDFMAVTGSLTLSIGQGTVTATNAAATTSFSAGQFGYIAGPGVAPTAITAGQLTSNAATSFSQLGNIPLPPGTGGAQGATNSSGYSSSGGTTSGGATSGGATSGSTATGGAATGGTAAGGTAATGAAAGGGLSTMAVVGSAAAVAAVAAIATNNNPTAAVATTTVTQ